MLNQMWFSIIVNFLLECDYKKNDANNDDAQ
jgi:hypothetical protein